MDIKPPVITMSLVLMARDEKAIALGGVLTGNAMAIEHISASVSTKASM